MFAIYKCDYIFVAAKWTGAIVYDVAESIYLSRSND